MATIRHPVERRRLRDRGRRLRPRLDRAVAQASPAARARVRRPRLNRSSIAWNGPAWDNPEGWPTRHAARCAKGPRERRVDDDDRLALVDEPTGSQDIAEREPDLREYLAPIETERQVTDWGRSERVEGFFDKTLVDFYYNLWFRCEVEGIEHVPAERRRAAGLQPLRRAAARRADDRQGDQGGASTTAPAASHGRALLQGLSRPQHADPQDRRRPRAPGQRPPAAGRRAAARARLPRGPQGHREALQGPLPPAPLRPRRLRRGGDARPGADRPDRARRRRGGDADLRPARRAAEAHRAHLLPDHADLPALRASSARSATCRPSSRSGSCRPVRPTTSASRRRGRTRRSCRRSPTTSARRSRTSCSTCSASAASVWFG